MTTAASHQTDSSETDGGWCSWDPHPWKHPWLTTENLKAIAGFSRDTLARERQATRNSDPGRLKVGFVGNIANAMYVRAVPMRRAGMRVAIYLHPQDQYAMSFPEWEDERLTVTDGVTAMDKLRDRFEGAPVRDVHQFPGRSDWQAILAEKKAKFLRKHDAEHYPQYMYYIDSLQALQEMDVLWATQCVYLGYLANKPYVVSQSGGDAWFETARNDELGRVMRAAFGKARLWLVSNPWSFAHARRLGFTNLIYLPKMMDETVYAPGDSPVRKDWEAQVGGDFFVLTSSRLDERNKGSSIGLEGFARFAADHPGARLAVIGWGNDREGTLARLESLGIAGKVVLLPLSSKAMIREYLKSADAFMDQFVLGYFGSAGLEAMACGVPVIGRLEMDQYAALCETGAPPVLNAGDSDAVCAHLTSLAADPDRLRAVAEATRDWFMDNHSSKRWLADHQAILMATAEAKSFLSSITGKHRIDFSKSPLARPLSDEEQAYHAAGLEAAPPYPNYGW